MTTESHIAALQRRHSELERQLEAEQLQPSHNDLEVSALKRRKLELKDQLTKLLSNAA